LTGVLPIDKPEGPTSHDVVAIVRRALRTREVGHTGTLDPFASGLLLICLGSATRLAEYLTGLPKAYLATLRLGEATDTDDLTGSVIGGGDAWRGLDEDAIRQALAAQVGDIMQLPPAYSAKKVEGERMYAVARRGGEVRRTAVPVHIESITVTAIRLPDVEFEVSCGSGTYIRAIARDAGETLGVGGHLRALRRTRVGAHSVEGALTLDDVSDPERVRAALITPLDAVAHMPRVSLDAEGVIAIGHGRGVPAPPEVSDGVPVALADGMRLAAIGERTGDLIRPRKVFPREAQP
jgi:tRNA pseudouridine55 synthase